MNELFYNITPDTVIRSLENCGFKPTGHCMALNSFENRVYDIKLESCEHIIAKFYRPGRWTLEQIQEEHDFLFELQEEEIPACTPLFLEDRRTIHSIEDVYFAVWPRTGGRAADEFSKTDLETLGRLLARIHNIGESKNALHRITLDEQTYAINPLNYLCENHFIPEQFNDRYQNTVEQIAEIYAALIKDVPHHRIHGDCHMGNLLHGDDGWFFLDFDDFLAGPAVQDIWMLLPAKDEYGYSQRDIFLESYRQFREFDTNWLQLIEPLRALRYIHYTGWIARRWNDPIFPLSFPHFGTESYWEESTTDLEDQLKIIYKSLEASSPEYLSIDKSRIKPDEPELTNADFFWDMKND
jgi:Ser/Thr protein kinase RdoA (MazF antagonist)